MKDNIYRYVNGVLTLFLILTLVFFDLIIALGSLKGVMGMGIDDVLKLIGPYIDIAGIVIATLLALFTFHKSQYEEDKMELDKTIIMFKQIYKISTGLYNSYHIARIPYFIEQDLIVITKAIENIESYSNEILLIKCHKNSKQYQETLNTASEILYKSKSYIANTTIHNRLKPIQVDAEEFYKTFKTINNLSYRHLKKYDEEDTVNSILS
ncbi:hypothetical protein [Macrococcoides canis]|uniref:Uncharacterized protein n=1 Tax=Macrococcoides canis TaxID=1855823 RepID=A0A4R6C6Q4_9STAP|nr:hypothetical protein [Macrococcus canis]TDM18114.1 hypothetical protein ETI04_01090 [Macrococcus canis]